jgi:hypothetical protein
MLSRPRRRRRCRRRRYLPLSLHALIVHLLWALAASLTCRRRWYFPVTVEAFSTQPLSTACAGSSSHLIITSGMSPIGSLSSEQLIDDIVINTQRIDPLRVPLVNAFYKKNNYRGKAKRSDVVFVAKRCCYAGARTSRDIPTDEIVGAVRLVPKTSDTYFIRNLFVAQECRRKGVGRVLMKAALDGNVGSASWSDCNSPSGCNQKEGDGHGFRYYCFLRRELSPIYSAAGLDIIDCEDENLPEWIRKEYLNIRAQQSGKDLILMMR